MVGNFKTTDIGSIPNDWDVHELGIVASFRRGSFPQPYGLPQWYDENNGMPFVQVFDVDDNMKLKPETKQKISEAAKDKSVFVPKGTIVLTIQGSIGRIAVTQYDAYLDRTLLIFQSFKKPIDKWFFMYVVYQLFQIEKAKAPGGTIKTITKSELSNFLIPLPPTKAEQTAIATALNDVDALISKLEKLIAKKRAIKQGAMQELLKPKEGWIWTTVEQLGKTYGGLSGKSKSDFKDGNCPYIPFMNVMSNPIIDSAYFDYVKIGAGEIQHKAIKGDLFFNGSSETPEEVGMCSILLEDVPNLYLNSFCFGFRIFKEEKTDGLYLAYFFRSSFGRRIFYILAQGATRHNLSKSSFMKIEFQIPNPDEQTHIAQIIFDLDSEIIMLEKKLEKYKMIKQGMMQVLLTGKIRLI